MKIWILESAQQGLAWMKRYYYQQEQLNSKIAFENFIKTQELLYLHPYIGSLCDGYDAVREMKIAKTVFSIVYTLIGETIYIIDIRDQRGLRSLQALESFADELENIVSKKIKK